VIGPAWPYLRIERSHPKWAAATLAIMADHGGGVVSGQFSQGELVPRGRCRGGRAADTTTGDNESGPGNTDSMKARRSDFFKRRRLPVSAPMADHCG